MPGASTLRDCKTLESIIKKQAERKRLYAEICASPAVALGSWGLLKGLKCGDVNAPCSAMEPSHSEITESSRDERNRKHRERYVCNETRQAEINMRRRNASCETYGNQDQITTNFIKSMLSDNN